MTITRFISGSAKPTEPSEFRPDSSQITPFPMPSPYDQASVSIAISPNDTAPPEVKTANANRAASHMPVLDGLRGLAILLVMIVHFQSDLPQPNRLATWLMKSGQTGWIGVDLFFVLSGFLITGILLRSRESPHFFRNFYIRRTLRIFPLYYAVLLVGCVVLPLLLVGNEDLRILWRHQIWLWFYSPNVISSLESKWIFSNETFNLGHFWSLAVEEHFYLFWPALVFFFPRHLLKICLTVIVGGLACRLFLTWQQAPTLVTYTLSTCRIDSLMYGAFIALMSQRGQMPKLRRFAPIVLSVCSAILLVVFLRQKGLYLNDPFVRTWGFSLLALLFGAVLVLCLHLQSTHPIFKVLSGRFLSFFGKYSYALYVFHPLLEPRFKSLLPVGTVTSLLHSNFLGMFAHTAVLIAMTIPFALASWYFLEQPFLNLKDKFTLSSSPHLSAPEQ